MLIATPDWQFPPASTIVEDVVDVVRDLPLAVEYVDAKKEWNIGIDDVEVEREIRAVRGGYAYFHGPEACVQTVAEQKCILGFV